ncbi:hypothetical protein [Massilia genomosp. 1]|uniref:Uncharacterized protein n=1 Tax=Massilia genomosp. 1 TaxID=2609280 RepID=A0ABX0MNA2_9BURK|nr:hypothetical protein [Massilia genomosp. 1]NHZ61488.1 hypothetical protein [Massilia genomosp. 1]
MTTQYKIHIVNQSMATQDFWCFLSAPEMNVGSTVYANSAANLSVVPNSPSDNSFTIPLQFSIGADASNLAVGLNVVVDSKVTENVELGQAWTAGYATTPPAQGPTLAMASQGGPSTSLSIASNHFNAGINAGNNWYESQSFGVESAQGFMGVTWAPNPGDVTTITPTLSFYVATGTFSANALAEMNTISGDCATISTNQFSGSNEAWVMLDSQGYWHVSSTNPGSSGNANVDLLIHSHAKLAIAHAQLVNYAVGDGKERGTSPSINDTVKRVSWGPATIDAETGDMIVVTGAMVLATAAVAITTFIVGGISFTANGTTDGGSTWNFSYNGPKTLKTLKEALKEGATIAYQK